MKSRYYMNRELWIKTIVPAGAIKITSKHSDAIAYTWEKNGKVYAAMWAGKRAKADAHYRYTTEQRRADAISRYFEANKSELEDKAATKAKRKAYSHTLKVGDFLDSSWGYDQTNIDFYQVVEVISDKTVKIRGVKQSLEDTGYRGQDRVRPVKDSWGGHLGDKPHLKRVGIGDHIRVRSYATASPYEGNGRMQTALGWGH